MNGKRFRQLSLMGVALAIAGAVAGYVLVSLWLGSADCASGRFGAACTVWRGNIGLGFQSFLAFIGAAVAMTPGILLFLCAAIRADEAAAREKKRPDELI